MADALKSVKVRANINNKQWPTVNIRTTKLQNTPQYKQLSGVVSNEIPNVQDSGGTVAGLKTICIPGYVGPA